MRERRRAHSARGVMGERAAPAFALVLARDLPERAALTILGAAVAQLTGNHLGARIAPTAAASVGKRLRLHIAQPGFVRFRVLVVDAGDTQLAAATRRIPMLARGAGRQGKEDGDENRELEEYRHGRNLP